MTTRLTAPLALAVASAISPTWAQSDANTQQTESDSTIEHVIVRGAYFGQKVAKGVKTPTLLLDTPQSISVMSAEQMSHQGMTSVTEVMQYSPGVSIGQGEDHRDQITIRGQNTTADFFIDGLRDDVQYFRPIYNLERIEVLRGANALLFGRGGGGGVINRVTKTADLTDTFTEFTAGVDTFDAGTVAIDGNVAIGDRQAIRINAMAESMNNHRDFKEGDRWAINPSYTIALSDRSTLVASWEYIDDDRVVDRGVPSLNGKPLRGFDETFFGDPNRNQTTLEANVARVRLDHRFSSGWSANATVQYADYDKLYQNLYPIGFDDMASTVSLDGYQDTTERENTLAQFNLVGQFDTGNIEHTLLTGLEYGAQKTTNARRDSFFPDSLDDQITFGFSDPLNLPEWQLTAFVRDRDSDVSFTSAFIQDEIALTDKLIAVAGLRWDRFEIDVIDRIEVADGSADGNDGNISSTDNELSPRAGLIYKPTADLSIYLSLSKSFLPRSGDQFLTLNPTAAALDPESFENREMGIKWLANDSLSLAASVFEITRENGTAVDPENPERSVLTGTETRGLELQLSGNPIEQLSVNASYTLLDGEELGRFSAGREANRDLAQLPRHKFTLWSELAINSQWRAGLGILHQSEQYASLSNAVALPSFTRVDAAAFYRVNDALELQLNIENLFDQDYFPAAHNDNNISVGRPVNARLGISYQL